MGVFLLSAALSQFDYEEGANGPHKPVLRGVRIQNVTSAASGSVTIVTSFPGAVIEDVRLQDCHLGGVEGADLRLLPMRLREIDRRLHRREIAAAIGSDHDAIGIPRKRRLISTSKCSERNEDTKASKDAVCVSRDALQQPVVIPAERDEDVLLLLLFHRIRASQG